MVHGRCDNNMLLYAGECALIINSSEVMPNWPGWQPSLPMPSLPMVRGACLAYRWSGGLSLPMPSLPMVRGGLAYQCLAYQCLAYRWSGGLAYQCLAYQCLAYRWSRGGLAYQCLAYRWSRGSLAAIHAVNSSLSLISRVTG